MTAASRLAVTALITAGLLAGCGIPTTGPISFGEAPRPPVVGSQMYFLLRGRLQPTLRLDPAGTRPDGEVGNVELLSAGPLPAEQAAGLTSQVPAGLSAVILAPPAGNEDDPVPTVLLLSRTIDVQIPGTPAIPEAGVRDDPRARVPLSAVAVEQIVCTVTAELSLHAAPVSKILLGTRKDATTAGPVSCPLGVPTA
jgi:hypothetical protein